MQETLKLCKNCKHFRRDIPWGFLFLPIFGWTVIISWWLSGGAVKWGTCRAVIDVPEIDFISGKFIKPNYSFASVERKFGCGKSAKFFEPK